MPSKPFASPVEYTEGRIRTGAYLSIPEGGDVPGVLVLHAWWGLNPFLRKLCRRFAEAGFVAFAPDLYDGKTAATIEEAKRLRSKLNRKLAGRRLLAAVDCLEALFAINTNRIGVVGFSLGANWALWLAAQRPNQVRAVVPFYGTRGGNYGRAKASFLGHFAENDDYVPLDSVKKLEAKIRSARKKVNFYVYPGTGHWFFEEDRAGAYDAKAARLAWKRTVDFLHATLG